MSSRNPPVPKTTQVVAGASVNIVLKKDQPTGRQVSGTVKDVLTRGDHHRGIKVRLTDGRIGRVQSLGSGASSSSTEQQSTMSSSGVADDIGAGGDITSTVSGDASGRGFGRRHGRYRDARLDDALERPPEQIGLDAYIRPAKQKGKRRKADGASQVQPFSEDGDQTSSSGVAGGETTVATCPVCGDFNGDEAAVAHHVASHFE